MIITMPWKFTATGAIGVRADPWDGKEGPDSCGDEVEGIDGDCPFRGCSTCSCRDKASLDRAQAASDRSVAVRGVVELQEEPSKPKATVRGRGSESYRWLRFTTERTHAAPAPPDAPGANGPRRILIVADNVDAATALRGVAAPQETHRRGPHTGPMGLELAGASNTRSPSSTSRWCEDEWVRVPSGLRSLTALQ